jgi:hypothetical protein
MKQDTPRKRRRQQIIRAAKAGIAQLDRGDYAEYDEKSLARFLRDVREEQARLDHSSENAQCNQDSH